jgi:hypothetical protein
MRFGDLAIWWLSDNVPIGRHTLWCAVGEKSTMTSCETFISHGRKYAAFVQAKIAVQSCPFQLAILIYRADSKIHVNAAKKLSPLHQR